jgi:DNA-binding Xre family transcriptional regulator
MVIWYPIYIEQRRVIKLKIRVRSNLGDYLRSRGIKKVWLATQIGADNSQLNRWCKNDVKGEAFSTPSVAYLLRIKKTLNCRLEDIYEEIPDESE